ncbi:hypothetical protein ACJJTC_018825 [Scirpophaga incertulas]
MSRELDKCSMERDRYKVLVEQMKNKKPVLVAQDLKNNIYNFTPTNTVSSGDMLAKTRDQNNILKLEVETLRSKLDEATGDIIALRKQLQKKENSDYEVLDSLKLTMNLNYCNKDYEELIQELEKYQQKYQQIQLDYRATLDEKEELVSDRDYYKNKVQRLNQQISYILSNRLKLEEKGADPPKPIVDLDALMTENKYLHERITQIQAEKEIIKRTLTKYKTLLDNRVKTESVHLKKGFSDVITQKQVRELLNSKSKTALKNSSVAELKSVCMGLLEAFNDKSIALQHQRKTNQILANRITELEKTMESWCNGQKFIPIFPSQMLLDELLPDTGSNESDDTKDKQLNQHSQESIKCKYAISSDEESNRNNSDDDSNLKRNCTGSEINCNKNFGNTVLPLELEELVKEALAEIRPMN